MIVNAKGSEAGGVYAHFKVLVDGQEIGDAFTTANHEPYIFPLPMDPSTINEVRVVFDNDAFIDGKDRNILVQSIELDGTVFPAPGDNVTYIRGDGSEYPYYGTMWWRGELVFDLSLASTLARTAQQIENDLNTTKEEGFGIRIMPNPSAGQFDLELSNATLGIFQLTMRDLSGRKVLSRDFQVHEKMEIQSIDASRLPKGLYVIQLANNNDQFIHQKVLLK